jgi:hypothetical protein
VTEESEVMAYVEDFVRLGRVTDEEIKHKSPEKQQQMMVTDE